MLGVVGWGVKHVGISTASTQLRDTHVYLSSAHIHVHTSITRVTSLTLNRQPVGGLYLPRFPGTPPRPRHSPSSPGSCVQHDRPIAGKTQGCPQGAHHISIHHSFCPSSQTNPFLRRLISPQTSRPPSANPFSRSPATHSAMPKPAFHPLASNGRRRLRLRSTGTCFTRMRA